MTEYEFTDEMGEISGMGESYEQACRNMVTAGARWLDRHPDAEPSFKEIPEVFGLIEKANSDAEELADAMVRATDGSPTGAMVHACVGHVKWIEENSWEEYVELMEEDDGK